MSGKHEEASEQRHNRKAERGKHQRWNPEQKYSQELISKSTGHKKRCEEQNRENPEYGRKEILCEPSRDDGQPSCLFLTDASKDKPKPGPTNSASIIAANPLRMPLT